MFRTLRGSLRFRTYEDEGPLRNLIWQDGGLGPGEIRRTEEADAPILHDLDGPVVPELDHPEVLLIGDLEFRKAVGLEPGLRGGDTYGIAGAGRHDLHAKAAVEPLADAAHHQRDGRTDVVHALPGRRLGQRAVQIHPDPALLVGRAGGGHALRRRRLIRRLAQVRGRRLRGEEGTKPREHVLTVGNQRAGARIEVGVVPRAALGFERVIGCYSCLRT